MFEVIFVNPLVHVEGLILIGFVAIFNDQDKKHLSQLAPAYNV